MPVILAMGSVNARLIEVQATLDKNLRLCFKK
jgi:hypothetical protein